MSIHSRNWRSAEREVVVCQYTVETSSAEREVVVCQYTVESGDQPDARLLYVNTK